MKKIFLFPFLLFSLCLMGQSQFEKTYFSQAYNDTFKNESVVIVRMMDESTYTTYGIDDYKVNVVFRAQYLLKDISFNNFSVEGLLSFLVILLTVILLRYTKTPPPFIVAFSLFLGLLF